MKASYLSIHTSISLGTAICLAGITTLPLTVWAVPYKQVPNPRQQTRGWVTDMANVLSPETETQLNQLITQLEAENGSEIAVVTVPDTSPSATPKVFATSLFNHWGIGKEGQDSGVLFLISKGDRRVEIETGYGVEAILPDAKVGQIIDDHILPKFKTGNFDQGATTGTQLLIQHLSADTSLPESSPINRQPVRTIYDTEPDFSWLWGILSVGGVWGVLGFLMYSLKKKGAVLRPGKRSRVSREKYSYDLDGRVPRCAHCKQALHKIASKDLSVHLTETEKVAQKLGSVKFIGWQCPTSSPEDASKNIHVRAYIWNPISFRECPECKEFTVSRSFEVLESATDDQPGKNYVTDTCECCGYVKEYEEKSPPLKLASASKHRSGSDNLWGENYGGGFGGGFGGDSGGGGGSFGAGDSGGGGAGGSW
ncbi:TPM domain-containing protein [Acaryochloris marina]|uniref:TPM domain-containing protein n=1 Tax=Acaryochloris marina (strain MBIC 11017) TaxID=329726 RepID=B0CAQ3_ACAM1|nr:TPM domain-containing protein [Acaryochloris marina]ABW30254.1 conserved hypothetical protein [Acaryochloris marina MBIC11017]BDM79084.1 hypothetical protein AM10699_19520 [Acaryochloris marina MBIC10699]